MVHRCAQLNLDATTTTWDFDNKLYLIYVSTILLHKYIEGIYWYTYICLHIWIGSLKLWKPPPSQAGQNPGWSLWRALKEFITNLVWVVQNEPRSAQKTLKVNNFLYIFIIQSQITSHARKHPYTLPYLYISTIYVEIYTPNKNPYDMHGSFVKSNTTSLPELILDRIVIAPAPWYDIILNEKHWKTHICIHVITCTHVCTYLCLCHYLWFVHWGMHTCTDTCSYVRMYIGTFVCGQGSYGDMEVRRNVFVRSYESSRPSISRLRYIINTNLCSFCSHI